jgi:hypothetical protein
MRDPKHDGSEEGKDKRRAEVIESNRHRMNPREKG